MARRENNPLFQAMLRMEREAPPNKLPLAPMPVTTKMLEQPTQHPLKSQAKRKPTVAENMGLEDRFIEIEREHYTKTDRTHINMLYREKGKGIVCFYAGRLRIKPEKMLNAQGILEQLGRIDADPDITEDTLKAQVKIAANALTDGRTVKQVERYLRHGRTTGKWDETLLTAKLEAATDTITESASIAGLTPGDLIAIVSNLEAYAEDNDAMADIMKREHDGGYNTPYQERKRCANMARHYANKVKAAFEAMTGQTFPQPTGDE